MDGEAMATKSIFTDVIIKDKEQAKDFIEALIGAENDRYSPKSLTRECKEVTGEKIKEFFE